MASRFAGFELEHVAGTPLLWQRDDRFKTFRIGFAMQRPLDGRQAARALLPSLLLHGTETLADRPAVARALEQLFGAWVGPANGRIGETAVLRLAAEAVAGDFLPGRPDQVTGVLRLLFDLATRPHLATGRLDPQLFERERAQALAGARAVFDDKASWARQQALVHGCAGEAYAVPDHGGEAAIAALTPGMVEQARTDFLARGRTWCVASGVLPADLPQRLEPLLCSLGARDVEAVGPPQEPARRGPRRTHEIAAMQQAKLVLIYRIPVPRTVADFCAAHAMVSLWGGGPHSRLFREVRERRSLCYYASAGVDAHKGVVLVQVGCDAGAVAAVVEEVERQRRCLADGECTDAEHATAIATILGSLQAVDDSVGARLQFTAEQWLCGFDQTPAERQESYRALGRDAIATAAAATWLDHEYALLPEASP